MTHNINVNEPEKDYLHQYIGFSSPSTLTHKSNNKNSPLLKPKEERSLRKAIESMKQRKVIEEKKKSMLHE
jgi:hypothetical protein